MRYWVHVPDKPEWCGGAQTLHVAQLAVQAAGQGSVIDLAAPVGHPLVYRYTSGDWDTAMNRPDGRFKDSREAAKLWAEELLKLKQQAGVKGNGKQAKHAGKAAGEEPRGDAALAGEA